MAVVIEGRTYYEHGEMDPGRPGIRVCGAKARHSIGPCQGPAMENGRCRMHGGKTPSGSASPHFKTGRYSKHLPERLAARYQEAVEDPDLLTTRAEIALVTTRINEVLERLDSGESGARWDAMEYARKRLADARLTGNVREIGRWSERLEAAVEAGHAEVEAWREVVALTRDRAKLLQVEHKRIEMAQHYLTIENAMALVAQLVDIVNRHVTDRQIRGNISKELVRLTGPNPSGRD